jgi:hypothetical protein
MLEDNLLNQTDLNNIDNNTNIQIYLQKNIKLWCYIGAIIIGIFIWYYSNT